MKKLLVSAIFISVLTNHVYATPNNEVCFMDGSKAKQEFENIAIESFSVVDYNITSKENIYIDKITKDNSNRLKPCLNILADRKRSEATRMWVYDKMGERWSESNMITDLIGDKTPEKLNFALELNIIFKLDNDTFDCKNFIVGQGSNGAGLNNWWLFSNNNELNQTLTCTNEKDNKSFNVKMDSDNNNRFDLKFRKIFL